MCGIAGYCGEGSRDVLDQMIGAIKHRGPDDKGTLLRGKAGLAHARLAIIDTSPAGHQPMELSDGSVAITFNGEIYNYQALREKLAEQGETFRSHSDTEVLLLLYKREGENFLKNAVGMFALALYDFKKEKLILARDRMGEKPLYWTIQKGTLYFASELSALMAANVVSRTIDPVSLAQYLSFDYVPTPRTILGGVSKLPPAHLLMYEAGTTSVRPFWQLEKKAHQFDEGEAIVELDAKLADAARGQLVSDVPLGVFLSGGIDSSAVAYYAQRASNKAIKTFSIGFEEPSFDESHYARLVAEHLGTDHHEERLSSQDALALIPEIADLFSEPVADASVLPTMLLSRFTRKHVTVALGGDGGDELFAGYPTFQAEMVYERLPDFLRKTIRAGAGKLPVSHKNLSFSYTVKKLVSEDEPDVGKRHAKWLGTFSPPMLEQLFASSIPDESELYEHIARYETELGGKNGLLWAYAHTYLLDQVLVKLDRASMHYSLETRAPLLDHRLVEYVFSLPYEMKYRRGGKYILKRTMRGKLPDTIIDRKKKGFGIPLASWLSGPLRPLCEELLSSAALGHGLFNQSYIDRLKTEHFERRKDNRKELWNLMVFQLWYQRYMR